MYHTMSMLCAVDNLWFALPVHPQRVKAEEQTKKATSGEVRAAPQQMAARTSMADYR